MKTIKGLVIAAATLVLSSMAHAETTAPAHLNVQAAAAKVEKSQELHPCYQEPWECVCVPHIGCIFR